MIGCYIHLPFCDRICPYCDFAVVKHDERRMRRYLAGLHQEIERTPVSATPPISTIYFGGGTPSTVGASDVASLIQTLRRGFGFAETIECTLECNPSRADDGRLRGYADAGVNRLSVGVQSFDNAELRRLGRDHSAAEAVAYLQAARAAGFGNVSLDLIAGAPGQTAETFARTLRTALECAPDHVSVYALTIEPGTPYAHWHERDAQAFPGEDATSALLELAHERLTGAGFTHYEISNFARPGFESKHNWGYWQQRDCLAFGLSASGYDHGVRYRNVRDFEQYCAAVESGASPRAESERLDKPARIGEAAMLALRTAGGIVDQDFRARFGVDPAIVFERARRECSAAGLLEVDAAGARLTDRGRLLANTVCAEFLTPEMEIARP